jgi:hypothetical protein
MTPAGRAVNVNSVTTSAPRHADDRSHRADRGGGASPDQAVRLPGDLDRLARLGRAEGHDAVIDGEAIVVPVELETGDPRARAVTRDAIAFDHGIVLSELRVRRPTLESHYLASVEGDHR